MAYTQGDLIEATHYNGFANSLNDVWGVRKNKVFNPGFNHTNSLPTGWASYNNGGIPVSHAWIGAVGPTGQNAHRVTANAAGATQLGIYTMRSVGGGVSVWVGGGVFVISFFAKAANAGAVGQGMYGLYSNMGFTSITTLVAPPLTTSWQRYAWIATANNNARTADGELFLSRDHAGPALPSGAAIDFCAPQVESGSTLTNWVDYSGYGQGTTLAGVGAGNSVTAAQWATLLARISSAASHQGSSITAITSPSAGNLISAYTALQGNVNTITANRRNANASGTDITAGGVGQRTTGWNQSIAMVYTISFASADSMHHFLNGGGHVRMSFSRSGGSAHSKNSTWTDLCNACGTIALSGGGSRTVAGTALTGTNKLGGSGSPFILLATTGVYDLFTSSHVNLYAQSSPTAPYTANYIVVRARLSANQAQLIVEVVFVDDAADDSIPAALDVVDGTLQTTMVLRPPAVTHISNTWGTPTMSVSVTGS